MYRIYSDDLIIYNPILEGYVITEGKVDLEVNKAGSLTMTIPDSNPHYGMSRPMRSIITLWDDDKLIFRGRPYGPAWNLFNDNNLICEGELAFFNDTIQEPFDYFGDVKTLFTQTIEAHNDQVDESRRFKVGVVDVMNDTEEGNITRSSIDYLNTWEFLKDKFFESELGGYLWVRHESDGNYIDYRKDLNFLGGQDVRQGINLVDMEEKVEYEGLATVILPLGAKKKIVDEDGNETGESDERITIEDANNGSKFIESAEGIEEYGRIVKVVVHDDIHDTTLLKRAGEADLGAALGVVSSIELTAADLSRAGYEVKPFAFGTYIPVKIEKRNIDSEMLLRKLSLDILNPDKNTIGLGASVKNLTGSLHETTESIGRIESNFAEGVRQQGNEIQEVKRETSSLIDQSEENILISIEESYYNKDKADDLLAEIRAEFEGTSSGFEMRFQEIQRLLENSENMTYEEFQTIKKYIRFTGGNIILGTEGSNSYFQIESNRSAFMVGGVAVSYWEGKKFFVKDIEIINSLKLGKFAFIPRPTGNLSFKKVVD